MKLMRVGGWWERVGGGSLVAAMLLPHGWQIIQRLFLDIWIPGAGENVVHLAFRNGRIRHVACLALAACVAAFALGGVASAHLSDRLVRRGWNGVRARKTVLTVAACFAPVGIFTSYFDVVGTLVVFSIVALVCTTWLFNHSALLAEVAPRASVASVHGICGACGAIGGLVTNAAIGPIVDSFGYTPVFVVAGSLHLTAAFILRGVKPREP